MTQEEKAKRYDETLEQLKGLIEGTREDKCAIVEEDIINIFPELQESEDEIIRKSIIEFFESQDDNTTYSLVPKKDILAWLEKQGQSTFDQCKQEGDRIVENPDGTHFNISQLERVAKVEPKFKIGDWVVYKNDICQIVKCEEGCNKLVTTFGIEKELVNERNLSTARLWTIADAKDGDVLAVDNMPFIYNGSKDEVTVGAYCGFNAKHMFSFAYNYVINQNITPATKEQQELLFVKIKEAGYKWDGEKKELRKMEQKPKWTDEDESVLQGIWDEILANKHESKEYDWKTYDKFLAWLETLKQRMEEEL